MQRRRRQPEIIRRGCRDSRGWSRSAAATFFPQHAPMAWPVPRLLREFNARLDASRGVTRVSSDRTVRYGANRVEKATLSAVNAKLAVDMHVCKLFDDVAIKFDYPGVGAALPASGQYPAAAYGVPAQSSSCLHLRPLPWTLPAVLYCPRLPHLPISQSTPG